MQIKEAESLKDLDGVRVAVEEPLPRGLSRDTIKSAVESQLRAERIPVFGSGDFPTGDPHLRVTISASAERNGLVAADVQVDFAQIVFLRRNPQVTFSLAQTWKADAHIAIVPAAQFAREVQRDITRQVAQFVADFRTVNS
jgi:hypothetical protein